MHILRYVTVEPPFLVFSIFSIKSSFLNESQKIFHQNDHQKKRLYKLRDKEKKIEHFFLEIATSIICRDIFIQKNLSGHFLSKLLFSHERCMLES